MTDTQAPEPKDQGLIGEMEKLEKAVRASVIPTWRQVLRGFLVGMSSALGALAVIVIIIPVLLYFLKNVEWIPLIGSFVERISEYTRK